MRERTISDVERAWDSRQKAGWAALDPDPFILEWLETYADALGRRIVDLGCGAGRYLIPLASMGFDVTGVELTTAGVERTRARVAESGLSATVLQGDFQEVDLGDRPFDSAIAIQSFQFGNWEHAVRSFERVVELLRSGGFFLCRVRSLAHTPDDIEELEESHILPPEDRGRTYLRQYDTGHHAPFHQFSHAELQYLIDTYGFEVVEGPTEVTATKQVGDSAVTTGQWNLLLRTTT